MKKTRFVLAILLVGCTCFSPMAAMAQQKKETAKPKPFGYGKYKATPEQLFDLVHTRLEVSFDYAKQRMAGKASITLKPHFYEQDTLVLDAKGMFINEVSLVSNGTKKRLPFSYEDSMELKITLPRKYRRSETLDIFIDYVARPNEVKVKGSAAITDAKGLYFINPEGKEADKAIQIWTQGETEATSVWCPTIDKPNQKTTQEILMTVPDKYVSLSNGTLISQKKNADGTRTDHWKMDQPHAPYLFFMGVGDYAIIKDKYKNIPVDYYVERQWESVARGIFGTTPEMIGFFSTLLRTPYPWVKYAQIVGQDYVSGAMENTTSTLHGAMAYQNARELIDENKWEVVVAHELFHQWFGDLVTTESWSNLSMNESFADYSEYLWTEYKYGREAADAYGYNAMQGYLANGVNAEKHLIRFYYDDKEEMFDAVSYQKGGRVLHMLRHHLGDSAFAWGMHEYLKQNRFGTGEAHQLRLAMEKVSGRDLNWFFNQWFFNNGHPEVFIRHQYDAPNKTYQVIIDQQQADHVFEIPVDIDIYEGNLKKRHTVRLTQKTDTFTFPNTAPTHVSVDGDKVILWQKDETKDAQAWATQYKMAANFLDKYEALTQLLDKNEEPLLRETMRKALQDNYYGIRDMALGYYNGKAGELTAAEEKTIETIALKDNRRATRSGAIDVLSATGKQSYLPLFRQALTDSSYSVAGAAMEAMLSADQAVALSLAPEIGKDAKGRLETSMELVEYLKRSTDDWEKLVAEYKKKAPFDKFNGMKGMLFYANRLTDETAFKKTAAPVLEFYNQYKAIPQIEPVMKQSINWLIAQKNLALSRNPNDANAKAQLEYIQSKLKN